MKFRKKPVVIEAFRLGFDNPPLWWKTAVDRGRARVKPSPSAPENKRCAYIDTLEGTHIADHGDWIIRGIKGELYPCKPDIFDMTYELWVDEQDLPY